MPPFPGTPGDDILYGTEDADLIEGFGGNDHLFGFGGDDTIDGGDGSDIIYGGTGADTLTGGLGDDYYEVDDVGDDVTELLNQGSDLVFTTIDYTLPDNVERLAVFDGSSTYAINLTGNTLNNEIMGNNGANLIVGGGGADILRGFGGDDSYIVDSNDYVGESAGGGYDIVFFNGTTVSTFHNNFDYSLLQISFHQTNHIEQLSVYDASSTNSVNLRGSLQDDLLTGNDGINVLDGQAGNDTMIGYGGDDVYFAGSGDVVIEAANDGYDTVYSGVGTHTLLDNFERLISGGILTGNAVDNEISGWAGADRIDGKEGRDILYGYGGDDFFVFTTALADDNVDQLVGYEGQRDRMLLDDAVFIGLTPGALPESAFRISNQVHTADDRIIYDYWTGKLYFDADGIGTEYGMQLFAIVHEGTPLTAAGDFTVI